MLWKSIHVWNDSHCCIFGYDVSFLVNLLLTEPNWEETGEVINDSLNGNGSAVPSGRCCSQLIWENKKVIYLGYFLNGFLRYLKLVYLFSDHHDQNQIGVLKYQYHDFESLQRWNGLTRSSEHQKETRWEGVLFLGHYLFVIIRTKE